MNEYPSLVVSTEGWSDELRRLWTWSLICGWNSAQFGFHATHPPLLRRKWALIRQRSSIPKYRARPLGDRNKADAGAAGFAELNSTLSAHSPKDIRQNRRYLNEWFLPGKSAYLGTGKGPPDTKASETPVVRVLE